MTELKIGHFYKSSDLIKKELSIKNPIVKIIAKIGQNCSIQDTEGRVFTLSTILLAENLTEARTVSNFAGSVGDKNEIPTPVPDSQPAPESEPTVPEPEVEPEPVDVEPETSPEEDSTVPQEEPPQEEDSIHPPTPEEDPSPTPEPEVESTPTDPEPQDNPYGDDPLYDDPYGDPYGDDYI